MHTHESQSSGFQPKAGNSKSNPLAPRSFEVTYPGQEVASSPTNPFPQRPHEVWMGEPAVARKPATPDTSEPGQVEPEQKATERDWSQFSLYAPGQPPPKPPGWNGVQAKLTIGQPNDPYEQEADRVAEQVMSMAPPATPNIQRQTEEELQTKPLAETITPLVQRQELAKDKEPIQAKCAACEQGEQVQRSSDSSTQAQPDLESRLNASQGGGSALPDEVRSFMEPRFGADFSQVRVHINSNAIQLNRELNAQAFTHKQDAYFGAGQAPGRDNLTAHELTHIVQQTQPLFSPSGAKPDSMVQRKKENEAPLAAIQGLAMYDLLPKLKGLPDDVRNDEPAALAVGGKRLVTATHAVQSQIKGMFWYDYTATYNSELSALPVDQIVDIIRFFGDKNLPDYLKGALVHWNDAQTAKQQAPGKIPPGGRWTSGTIPPELLVGTRPPTPAERDKIRDALQPIATVGGALPDFQPKTAKGSYEIRIRVRVQKWIDNLYKNTVVGRGRKEHNDPKNLHPMNRFEEIASAAKQEVDAVFGSYASGPAFVGGVNLFDAWAKNDAEIFGKPDATGKLVGGKSTAAKFEQAKALVQYMFGADREIREINTEHNAVPTRTTPPKKGGASESKILEQVAITFAKTQGKKLIEIDRAWPGTAGGGKVNLAMWKAPTDDGNRRMFWDAFQTMIHEYLHTLAHPDYNNYVNSFAYGTPQQNTLDEGVDSLLTETVWSNVVLRAASSALRNAVEGSTYAALPFNPALVPSIIETNRYPSYAQAKAVAGITGIQNLYAAYFLGKVDLIRASPPP